MRSFRIGPTQVSLACRWAAPLTVLASLASGCVDRSLPDSATSGEDGGSGGDVGTAGSPASASDPSLAGGAGGGSAGQAADESAAGADAASSDEPDPVPPELRQVAQTGLYAWKNVVIKGGGFVTGIVFSTAAQNLIYARTDVGGAYRYNPTDARWVPLTDWVGRDQGNLLGIESVAADPVDPSRVYLAAGTYMTAGPGSILASSDYGNTWAQSTIAAPMGGNAEGRSMGERLVVDPNQPETLYFGSRANGLWVSHDSAETWNQVTAFPVLGDLDLGLSFVVVDPRSGEAGEPSSTLYVGVATLSGDALYRSADAGETWEAVADQPTGMMPHHAVIGSDGVMVLVYNDGPGPNDITAGAVWSFDPEREAWLDITPSNGLGRGGYGGVAVDASDPSTIVICTIDVWTPDEIFRTIDGGTNWRRLGPNANRDPAGAQWLYFSYSDLSATGWMGDIELDPFNPDRVLHTTGQGIWWTDDVTSDDSKEETHWMFRDDGLEETVPLDLVSPPEGAHLLSALGDIAGFRHDDLDQSPPAGMYGNPRFGNTTSLDFAEEEPSLVVRVGTNDAGPRGAYSTDGAASWTPFAAEPEASEGSGSIAVSADGATWVWSPRRIVPAVSTDRGGTWTSSVGPTRGGRVAADRVNPEKFYLASSEGFFVSTDGGATFTATMTELSRSSRPRTVFGREGDVWLLTNTGLMHSTDSGSTFVDVPGVTSASGLGFGQAAADEDYPAVYLSATVDGVGGLFRSDDAGASFERIDDSEHQFGWVSQITGDPRIHGRVYVGTGGRGILYGDPR